MRWARCGRGEPNGCGRQRGGTQVMGRDGSGQRREAGMGGAAWRAPWERVTVGRGPDRGKRGTGERAGGGKQNWGAALAAHGCRMRAAAHFWRSGTVAVGDGCCEGGCGREGEMKKRPHMRSLYVKAISFERLYGKLERELRLSSSRRVPQSSSWGERIRGKLQEPWCQQRCGRSYGIPKP